MKAFFTNGLFFEKNSLNFARSPFAIHVLSCLSSNMAVFLWLIIKSLVSIYPKRELSSTSLLAENSCFNLKKGQKSMSSWFPLISISEILSLIFQKIKKVHQLTYNITVNSDVISVWQRHLYEIRLIWHP